jgi:hypothetical protein
MQNIKINDTNYIEFNDTEWNSKVLGYKTNEIYSIQFETIDAANELLIKFEEYCSSNDILYTSLRINPDSKNVKNLLENFGFANVETSIFVNTNLKNIKQSKILDSFKFNIRECNTNDIDIIKSIASTEFKYGRFFEDPKINISVAKVRNSNWINDLFNKSKILVGEKDGVVFGFMAFRNKDGVVNLELGGVDSNYSHLAYSFWYRVFEYLKMQNMISVNAMISSHNIGIINLYSFFDFKFTHSYIGYRKLRNN